MFDENDLIQSPLNQTYEDKGRKVEIHIYRMPDTGWTLEVVDDLNNSTVRISAHRGRHFRVMVDGISG